MSLQADCFRSSIATKFSSRGPTWTGSDARRSALRPCMPEIKPVSHSRSLGDLTSRLPRLLDQAGRVPTRNVASSKDT